MSDGLRSAQLVIDRDLAYSSTIEALEEVLYGSEAEAPRLPTPQEVMAIFEENSILQVVDHGDGSFTVTGPDEAIQMLDATSFEITWASAVYVDAETYTIHSLLGASLPVYWLGYLLIILFAVKLQWLPVAGRGSFAHLILPALALGLAAAAIIARLLRSTLLEVLREDYIRTARAKGASEYRVILGHALRNALLPIVTILGIHFAHLLGGTVIVEVVFAWPGLGQTVIEGIFDRDYPLIQGFVLFMGIVFVLVNLVVDITYTWIDPRVQLTRTIGPSS
jgi:hypothetical protein